MPPKPIHAFSEVSAASTVYQKSAPARGGIAISTTIGLLIGKKMKIFVLTRTHDNTSPTLQKNHVAHGAGMLR
ncbi:hypothetical protein C1T17_05060 [Sphingobium sp. SCG-1]|nr:hypothetical protein C1T17_05060 [Sphingobium sp. SCG-1]